MTSSDTRYCRKCGKAFTASPNDYTVNCPEHRGRPTVANTDYPTRRKDPRAPRGATGTVYPCTRPAVVCVPGTTDLFECEVHAPKGSY